MGQSGVVRAAAAAAVFLSSSASAQKLGKAERAAIAATHEEAAAKMQVIDDPLNTIIRVTSEPFYQENTGVLGMRAIERDRYLRAFIDRKTGETRIQLVAWAWHSGDWIFPDRGVAESPEGPLALAGHTLATDVRCSTYGCRLLEGVALDAPEPLLRWVASQSQPGREDNLWRAKVYGRYTDGTEIAILRSEVAGFLMALDRLKASRPTPATVK